MKTVKTSVFAIGVALSATPFFNSALAQSGTESGAVLLELQTLRNEIAELRDMVERQQFELRKVRQELSKRPALLTNPAPSTGVGTGIGSGAAAGALPNGGNGQFANQGGFPNPTVAGTNPYLDGGAVVGDQGNAAYGQPQQSASDQAPQFGSAPVAVNGNQAPNSTDKPSFYGQGAQVSPQGVSARDYAEQVAQNQRESGQLDTPQSGSTVASAAQPNWTVPASQTGGATPQPSVNPGSRWVQSGTSQSANKPVLSIPTPTASSQSAVPQNDQAASVIQQGIDAAQVPSAPQEQFAGVAEQSSPTSATSQFTEDQFYDRGFDFLKQSKYDEAVSVFEQQIATYPQGSLADDAHYWIAEAMFIDRKPADARPHLRAIIDNYPQSPRLPDAMLKTAYIEQEMGNVIEARILLQEVVAKYPSSNAAIAAKNRLQNLSGGN